MFCMDFCEEKMFSRIIKVILSQNESPFPEISIDTKSDLSELIHSNKLVHYPVFLSQLLCVQNNDIQLLCLRFKSLDEE